MSNQNKIDILESDILNFDKSIIEILLSDRTTKKNIIWATNDYLSFGKFYNPECQITIDLVVADENNIIKPRILKSQENQLIRTKAKAEVFTPSWICNAQNNLVDLDWVEDKKGFNDEIYKSWVTNKDKVIFKNKAKLTWQKYVDAVRMEITCGEAPYLVSRYDATTGEYIEVENRIGLLDRKLRIINENVTDEKEWYKWTVRAFQSIYGYEFQGDSLLLARENLLYTFIDHLKHKFNRKPDKKELKEMATIISWNIWQMDGLKFTVPYSNVVAIEANQQISFFQEEVCLPQYCLIKDWQAARWNKKSIIEFRSLMNKGKS